MDDAHKFKPYDFSTKNVAKCSICTYCTVKASEGEARFALQCHKGRSHPMQSAAPTWKRMWTQPK